MSVRSQGDNTKLESLKIEKVERWREKEHCDNIKLKELRILNDVLLVRHVELGLEPELEPELEPLPVPLAAGCVGVLHEL